MNSTLVFISDIHGDIKALEKALDIANQFNPHKIVLCGDILNHGPRNPIPQNYKPEAVAEVLNSMATKIIAIRGNCDSEVDQMLLNFPILQSYTTIVTPERDIFVTHGHLDLPPLAQNTTVVSGHTHIPVYIKKENLVFFNPGSITFPKNGHEPTLGLYHNNELNWVSILSGNSYNPDIK